jgi:CRISPR/Cas system-associated exonuclease Cas4 (RecB family)
MPQNSLRASSIGDPCDRRHVYSLTRALDQLPIEVGLQRVFDEGNIQERAVVRELQEAGIDVHEQQRALEWREYNITGSIDCVIHPGNVVCDIKSMSPHIWGSIFQRGPGVYQWSEVAEKFNSKPWLRKYRAQITIYLLMKDAEMGMLLCKDKSSGALAQVDIPLDYEYGEELLKRAERVNAHVKEGTIPERIQFDEEVCPSCAFYHICLPERVGKDPLVFLEDAKVVEVLDDLEVASQAGQIYLELKEKATSWAKAREENKISIGHWLVEKVPHGNGVRVLFTRI